MTDRVIVGSNKHPINPTPLSAPQEQQVRDLYYKNVRAKCAAEIESTYRLFDSPVWSRGARRKAGAEWHGIWMGVDGMLMRLGIY
jgi:hypothetical protein